MASNGFMPWMPGASVEAGEYEIEAAEMELGDRESYGDEGYASFLQLLRAGQKQSKVWIPTKKGGHETVLKCGYPCCYYVSMSKAENDRHVRCHHSYDPIDFNRQPDDLLVEDLARVEFDLGTDAVPVLPKRKKPKTTGGGAEVIESSDDDVELVMEEEGGADDDLGGAAGLVEFVDDEEGSDSAEENWRRCKEAAAEAEEEGTPVATGGSDAEVGDGEGGGGDAVEPVQIFSAKMDEIVAWFYLRRGRNVHACLSTIEDGAAKALLLCNQRKRSGAAEFAEPCPLRSVHDVRESGRKVCPQCWEKISDASKAWLAEELAFSQLP